MGLQHTDEVGLTDIQNMDQIFKNVKKKEYYHVEKNQKAIRHSII